jgi:trehalose 6-phosphate synthase
VPPGDIPSSAVAATADLEGRLEFAYVPPEIHASYYEIMSNSVLWPMFHGGFDRAAMGYISRACATAWAAYKEANTRFADAICRVSPARAIVVIHDYQLMLVPGQIAQRRPDLDIVFYHHIPFVDPDEFGLLPRAIGEDLLASLNQVPSGFQAGRWRSSFEACCAAYLGTRDSFSFVQPVSVDAHRLTARLESSEVLRERGRLRELVGDRLIVAHIGRMDPMKNLLRGLQAADGLLESAPDWAGEVVFVNHLVPTRADIDAYANHRVEVERLAAEINAKWATAEWSPIVMHVNDSYSAAIALLAEYDVLCVNPVREGMNLVALEGPLLNQRNGLLLLSTEAGAFEYLGDAVIALNPLHLQSNVAAVAVALSTGPTERLMQAEALRERVRAASDVGWHRRLEAVTANWHIGGRP